MIPGISSLTANKKIYFASDFHLGAPSLKESREREFTIVKWLNQIEADAQAIFLLGDIFDFWFEYKYVVPKGFVRLLGKLADLTDKGIPVVFFTGNHDMWMFDYFPQELNIPIYRQAQTITINDKKILIGHGDGLGETGWSYKLLKKIFSSSICQWAFARIHPNFGFRIAHFWSKKSREGSSLSASDSPDPEKEWIFKYCQKIEEQAHHDYYVFGHRHLTLDLEINQQSRYINIGEWMDQYTYGIFDGKTFKLLQFEK